MEASEQPSASQPATAEELAMTSFRIIAAVGSARSAYIEAIHAAKDGDFDRAERLMQEGGTCFLEGHDVHTELVQREAAGDPVMCSLMLTHAEDQLMSAESFKIIAEELIDLCRRVDVRPVADPAASQPAADAKQPTA